MAMNCSTTAALRSRHAWRSSLVTDCGRTLRQLQRFRLHPQSQAGPAVGGDGRTFIPHQLRPLLSCAGLPGHAAEQHRGGGQGTQPERGQRKHGADDALQRQPGSGA
ncbi:hypothetical protein G6F31_018157 [Rhizopus arrhizus]|nr:hypothetical protein G6F31_018157 [Rhizopus arrhizus]